MVEALAFPSDGVSAFKLTDAVSARKRRAMFRVLERAFDAGEKPHRCCRRSPARSTSCGRRGASSTRAGRPDLGAAAGVHEFRAKKAVAAAGGWSAREAALATAGWPMPTTR